ncbi:hypothetical protein FT640_04530 [Bacillus paranthracis]|nr:hypothetical protein [Bacillus paranthracis]
MFLFCFFLVIYYLVGAYKGLGRGFNKGLHKKELFQILILDSSFIILSIFDLHLTSLLKRQLLHHELSCLSD